MAKISLDMDSLKNERADLSNFLARIRRRIIHPTYSERPQRREEYHHGNPRWSWR